MCAHLFLHSTTCVPAPFPYTAPHRASEPRPPADDEHEFYFLFFDCLPLPPLALILLSFAVLRSGRLGVLLVVRGTVGSHWRGLAFRFCCTSSFRFVWPSAVFPELTFSLPPFVASFLCLQITVRFFFLPMQQAGAKLFNMLIYTIYLLFQYGTVANAVDITISPRSTQLPVGF